MSIDEILRYLERCSLILDPLDLGTTKGKKAPVLRDKKEILDGGGNEPSAGPLLSGSSWKGCNSQQQHSNASEKEKENRSVCEAQPEIKAEPAGLDDELGLTNWRSEARVERPEVRTDVKQEPPDVDPGPVDSEGRREVSSSEEARTTSLSGLQKASKEPAVGMDGEREADPSFEPSAAGHNEAGGPAMTLEEAMAALERRGIRVMMPAEEEGEGEQQQQQQGLAPTPPVRTAREALLTLERRGMKVMMPAAAGGQGGRAAPPAFKSLLKPASPAQDGVVVTMVKGRVKKRRLFRCDACDYTTRLRLSLHNHRIVRHDAAGRVIRLACDQCAYTALNMASLKMHVMEVHLNIFRFRSDAIIQFISSFK